MVSELYLKERGQNMYKVHLEILMGDLTRAGFPFMTEISLCLKWVFAKISFAVYFCCDHPF